MWNYCREIIKRKDLLWYLVKSGLKAEHRNSYLGYFWWLLDPLLNAAVYYFLIVVVLGRGGENFAVFLVVGLVAWRWTSTSLNSSAKAILQRSSIINQVNLPKVIFPMTKTFTQMVNFTFGLVVVAVFLALFKIVPDWKVLFLPVVMLVQLVFLLAISILISYVCVFIRDFDNILNHITRIWFYSSPVIWQGDRLPAEFSWIVDLNPFSHIVGAYRDILMYQAVPNLSSLAMIGISSIFFLIALIYYYSKNEHKIIKAL